MAAVVQAQMCICGALQGSAMSHTVPAWAEPGIRNLGGGTRMR